MRPSATPCWRTGKVTSTVSDLRRVSSAASFNTPRRAASAALTASFRALIAAPCVLRSSAVILPSPDRSAETEPFLPSAATRTVSGSASSPAAAMWARIVVWRSLRSAMRKSRLWVASDALCRSGEPAPHIRFEQRRKRPPHARMIAVQPFDLFRVEQLRFDQGEVDRRQREGFESIHFAFGAFDESGLDDDEVFDPHPPMPGPIIAGLVGEDHAWLQRRRTQLRDALRPLMDGQV